MWKRRECDDKNAMKLDTIESSQIVMRIFFSPAYKKENYAAKHFHMHGRNGRVGCLSLSSPLFSENCRKQMNAKSLVTIPFFY